MASGMSTQFVNGMAVEIDGDGDDVLLIHGMGGSSNVWTPVMQVLGRYRSLRPDLPGSGRSGGFSGPLSIGRFVQSILDIFDAADVDRAHVVAHSFGTAVALQLALQVPTIVSSLALLGPILCPTDARRPLLRERARALRRRETDMQALADQVIPGYLSRETLARRPVAVAFLRESLMNQDPDGYARTLLALADTQAAEIAKIACPALLITGDEDSFSPPDAVRQMADRMRDAKVEIFRNCGHCPMLEQPEATNDALRRFYA
jgi:3-oxoadipate enol-lactonase